ncbi:MAG: ribonuclease Y [Chlamydiales bacterium]|nr:ribonuclease Y [Chlamydiales bacterium]
MGEDAFQLLIIILVSFAVGGAAAWLAMRMRLGGAERIAAEILSKAEQEAVTIRHKSELAVKQSHIDKDREFELQRQQERTKHQREEERLKTREDKLEQRLNAIEKKTAEIERRESSIQGEKQSLEKATKEQLALRDDLLKQLEKVSGLTSSEAKEHLLQRATNEIDAELAHIARRKQKEAEETADNTASTIIATAINRLCVPCVSDATVTTVNLPSEDMKGRIIGREGRNIRMLERELGVNILVDDTPGAIVLSGFDPIRKHVAKMVLTELLQDGRIHPTRIQEVIDQKRIEVNQQIKRYGEDAALRAGALNLHPELMQLLGQLKFRYSYGQNILDHSLEVSYLLGMMAAELGLDARLAKRIGLLHDIGKAVSHEIEGSHAIVGHDLALKYGESQQVANGIGCHHYEMEAKTVEASLCSAADSLSASRPGARIGAIEEYIKRLKDLEEITYDFPGIERAYAMQAGREIQITVLPEVVDDAGVAHLARDISKRIEQRLNYPGRVKVTVVREKRVVEYAG